MKILLLIAGLILWAGSATAALDGNQVVRAIIGEAANQSYQAKLGIACVIRNRGSLQGIYGGKNTRMIDTQPKYIWAQARKAWVASATIDVTHGCKYFGGTIDDTYFFNKLHKTPALTIGHTRFYK